MPAQKLENNGLEKTGLQDPGKTKNNRVKMVFFKSQASAKKAAEKTQNGSN